MQTPTAEEVWWERLDRELSRRGFGGDQYLRFLLARLLQIKAGMPGLRAEPGRWEEMDNPYRCDDQSRQRGLREVFDEIGRYVGVGPRPL